MDICGSSLSYIAWMIGRLVSFPMVSSNGIASTVITSIIASICEFL
jgi:hypothetical protein